MALLGLLAFFTISLALSKDNVNKIWVPMDERIKIWDSIAGKGNYKVSENGLEATFEKEGAKWTIMGANASKVAPTIYPKAWPVKGDGCDVMVIPQPITDYKILPFTENIENAVTSKFIEVTAARDSYEAASFVIRTGDADLEDINIEATNLIVETKDKDENIREIILPRENVDIRVVKCWYQAGFKHDDIKHKRLVPELLLHDDKVIKVDYSNQVNVVKDFEKFQDANILKPFSIPKKQNKQIWLTVHIGKDINMGDYTGEIKIVAGARRLGTLKLVVKVLPFVLPAPMLNYAVYYLGYLSEAMEPVISSTLKTQDQMYFELVDMKEHGLTNATLYHESVKGEAIDRYKRWKKLEKTLAIKEKMGWGSKPLLYLDWTNAFSNDLDIYRKKVEHIVEIAKSLGINDVYIYGVDEKKGKELRALRPMYQTVHSAGAKNFVACMDDFFSSVPDLIDLPVLHGLANRAFMSDYKRTGKELWVYANIKGEVEMPETYRYMYGGNLLKEGFTGTCIFAYQVFSWNDFANSEYHAHTLAYPTINKPTPTIQWEGLRQGINDIRYLTLLKQKGQLNKNWLQRHCFNDLNNCRSNAIKTINASFEQ